MWRAVLYARGDPWLRIYVRTDARADALAIGAALALECPEAGSPARSDAGVGHWSALVRSR